MKHKVLYITAVWPEPQSSAAGLRCETIMRAIEKAGWDLVLSSPSKVNEHFARYRDKGVEVYPIALNDSEFDSWVAELSPTIVIYDRFVTEEQYSARVRRSGVKCTHVLDTQDLHFLRHSREMAIHAGASIEDVINLNIIWDENRVLRELASICRSDLTYVLSDFERDLLIREFDLPGKRIVQSSFAYSDQNKGEGFSWQDRKDFVFIGNYRHAPNKDGIMWFVSKVWPLIRSYLPSVKLNLYGAYPDRDIVKLEDSKKGIFVKGWAPNQFEVLGRARVNLAPLRYGAGIKGKIVDGWSVGTPCITTAIGAEGLRVQNHTFGGVIANGPEEFAKSAVQLYEDHKTWLECQKASQDYFTANASALVSETIIKSINAKVSVSNWMSKILDREEARSTEYFSRWIEEKNKNVVHPQHAK